jgi:diguanylate cyclase (GGDEF)-like protein
MMKFDCDGYLDALSTVCDEPVPIVSELVAQLGLASALGAPEHAHEAAQRSMAAVVRAEREIATLRERIVRLEALVATDELTGVLNRRGFEAEMLRTLDLARRHGETGVLLFVDLDDFKRINDTFGHAAGDEVLRHVALLLKKSVRRSDVVARLGGDEFVVLLTKACAAGGTSRRVALEQILRSAVVHWHDQVIRVDASVGARPYGPCDQYDALIRDADEHMYAEKSRRCLNGSRLSGGSSLYRNGTLLSARPAETRAP